MGSDREYSLVDTLHELRSGAEITLQLHDRREIRGIFRSFNEGKVSLDGIEDEIAVDRIDTVLLEFRTEGPE